MCKFGIFTLEYVILTLIKGSMISVIYCPYPNTVTWKETYSISINIPEITAEKVKVTLWWPLTLKMYSLTQKSISSLYGPYLTKILCANILGHPVPEKMLWYYMLLNMQIIYILTLTFVTLTFKYIEYNKIKLLSDVLCPFHR